jgi:hypothetical protein
MQGVLAKLAGIQKVRVIPAAVWALKFRHGLIPPVWAVNAEQHPQAGQ